jgi:endo-1,4-beta-xylanase
VLVAPLEFCSALSCLRRATALAAVAALLIAATATSAASGEVVAVRGLSAANIAPARVLSDPRAPDRTVVVLSPRHPIIDTVTMLATREVQLTAVASCSARLRLRIDHHPLIVLPIPHTWRAIRIALPLTAGTHRFSIRARSPRGRRCADPRLDRIDFLPVGRQDGVPLGAGLREENLYSDPIYRNTFTANFDSLSPENALKMDLVEPAPGIYNFELPDALVDYAVRHDKAVRGHTLVWGLQLPQWITTPAPLWTRSALLGVMHDYITTVMHHYAGRIESWDVVNEAINEDGSYVPNIWYEVIGPSYVEDAFRFAHAADPTATLTYNDGFDAIGTPKAEAVFAMVRDLRSRGVPIDAVGIENHVLLPGYPSESQLQAVMMRYAALGLRVEITEMDVGIQAIGGATPANEQQQALAYRAAAAACWDVAACQRMTTWGVGDAVSWLGIAEAPLLFSATYQPKPAFFAVRSALHG